MKSSLCLLVSASLVFLSVSAHAAPPANKDACLAKAFELADQAAKKKFPEAQALQVEQLITAVEAECVAGDMTKADVSIKTAADAIALP